MNRFGNGQLTFSQMRVADSASSLLYLQKILNLYVYKAINFALLKTRIVKEMLTCKCKEGKHVKAQFTHVHAWFYFFYPD